MTGLTPSSWVGVVACLLSLACNRPGTTESAAAAPSKFVGQTSVKIGFQKAGAPFLLKAKDTHLREQLSAQQTQLQWLEFQTGPLLLEAMRAGEVDIGYVGETPPVFAQAGGVPFVYVATDRPSPISEAIIVPGNSTLKSVAELRGKKVAFNRGSNVHYLVLRALEKAGLSLSDVHVESLAPADARVAFDSGQVDAWAIWDPFYAAAELKGARLLQDGTDLVDNHQFYVARKEFASEHAELVKVVLDAFSELSTWAEKNPEEAARLTAESSGIAYEALLKAEHRHSYGMRPITKEILAKQQTIADAFLKIQVVPQAIDTQAAYLAAAGFKTKQ